MISSKFATNRTFKFESCGGKFHALSILVAFTVTRTTHHRKAYHFKMTADPAFSACADDYVHQSGVGRGAIADPQQ